MPSSWRGASVRGRGAEQALRASVMPSSWRGASVRGGGAEQALRASVMPSSWRGADGWLQIAVSSVLGVSGWL